MKKEYEEALRPTGAFVNTSIVALVLAIMSFFIGLWNADLQLNEKGYYFSIIIFGLFSVITLQKTIRDELEGIFVTKAYKNLNIVCLIIPIMLMLIGLFNVDTLQFNEKGFFGISFAMTLFAAIVVQKNVRDAAVFDERLEPKSEKIVKEVDKEIIEN